MRRQAIGQRCAERVQIKAHTGLRHQIAHQLTGIAAARIGWRIFQHQRVSHRLFNPRQRQQSMIDFTQFNALPTYF
ncbi:hypothetical protein D3C86_1952360 [compost metagenome]